MRPTALFTLLLFGLSSAMVVGPAIYEQRDFGNLGDHQFTYSLSADCNASVITAIVYNESNKPVRDAIVLLSYVDFAQPLLANVLTDKDGTAVLKLPGQVTLMRGLFILVIQKSGFKNKEVHFDLYPCFHNGSLPPKPPPPPPPPKQNYTIIVVPEPGSGSSSTPPPGSDGPAQVNTSNSTSSNFSGVQPGGSSVKGICPSALVIASLLFFKGRK
jgi:hypothetical protein